MAALTMANGIQAAIMVKVFLSIIADLNMKVAFTKIKDMDWASEITLTDEPMKEISIITRSMGRAHLHGQKVKSMLVILEMVLVMEKEH